MNYNHIPPDIMTKFLTDDLSPEERHTAELHIAVCPECAAKLDEQRRFEDAAARSYPKTFPDRLDPECRKAINDAVRERLNTPENSPVWVKRIRGNVLIQFFTVAAVAILLIVMITAPSGKTGGKKEKDAVPDKEKTALVPDKVPVPVKPSSVKPAEVKVAEAKPAPAAIPEKKTEEVKPVKPHPEQQKETDMLNPGLMRLLAMNEISLRPPEKETFRQGAVCMDSPFEPGARVLLAVSAPKTASAEKAAGLHIHPAGKTVLLTRLAKPGEEDVIAAVLLCEKTADPGTVFVRIDTEDGSAAPFAVSAKDVLKSGDVPPAPLRLAAVMLAAGKPRLLLKRETREKMIEELRSLVKNEYAGAPGVVRFLEKLEKVK